MNERDLVAAAQSCLRWWLGLQIGPRTGRSASLWFTVLEPVAVAQLVVPFARAVRGRIWLQWALGKSLSGWLARRALPHAELSGCVPSRLKVAEPLGTRGFRLAASHGTRGCVATPGTSALEGMGTGRREPTRLT